MIASKEKRFISKKLKERSPNIKGCQMIRPFVKRKTLMKHG
jgi:hypothetical protein